MADSGTFRRWGLVERGSIIGSVPVKRILKPITFFLFTSWSLQGVMLPLTYVPYP